VTELHCKVRADPEPEITWVFPDGNEIRGAYTQIETLESNVNGLVVKTSIMRLRSTTRNETGLYNCQVNNRFGMVNQSIWLNLHCKCFNYRELINEFY